MSTFQFDTSGEVLVPEADGPVRWKRGITWATLPSDFVRGYFHAIAREAWESLDQNQKDRIDHFGPIAFSDFSPELVGRGMRDCEAMQGEGLDGTAAVGQSAWAARQGGLCVPEFPPLRLVIAEDGLLHSEERK